MLKIESFTQSSSGFDVPSDFTDQILTAFYGEPAVQTALSFFGCPTVNGNVQDCHTALVKFFQALAICRTRKAFDGFLASTNEAGQIFATQFELRNCDQVNGVNTKSCHCSEQGWIWSISNPGQFPTQEQQDGAQALQNAYGQFFRDGTAPGFTDYKDLSRGQLNVIGDAGLVQVDRWAQECDFLDQIDDYALQNWAFRNQDTTTTTTTTTTTVPTTTSTTTENPCGSQWSKCSVPCGGGVQVKFENE